MNTTSKKLIQDQIKDTNTYKNLSRMMQIIVVKRNNALIIENGVKVSKNIGYDNWIKQTHYNWANKCIVKDILNQS